MARGMPSHIAVDQKRLRQSTLAFMRSKQAESLLRDSETSFLTSIFTCFIALLAGLVTILTVKWAKTGFGFVMSCMKLEMIRQRKSPWRKHPELAVPLICHAVIVSPDGSRGLVLGTFDPSRPNCQDEMARMAQQLGRIYVSGPESTEQQEIYELLRDDVYQPQRRRATPNTESALLFDVRFETAGGMRSPFQTLMYAFVAMVDEGPIKQIPWSVVDPAVRIETF